MGPEKNSDIKYLNYPFYAGGNRGRGQVYPTGEKSNVNTFGASQAGQITEITTLEKGESNVVNINPNAGGFGQEESEIVLQNPVRIFGYLFFCLLTLVTQILLVLKKKKKKS